MNNYILWWSSEDCQGEMKMGDFDSMESAMQEAPAAKAELLDQCHDEDGTEEVERGTWSVCDVEGVKTSIEVYLY